VSELSLYCGAFEEKKDWDELDPTISASWRLSKMTKIQKSSMVGGRNFGVQSTGVLLTNLNVAQGRDSCRYIEHTAGYRRTCNQCGDPSNPPKRDGEVTKPVYDCGQGNCPLGKVPGASAGRSGAPNFPIGYAFPLSPARLRASSASLLV
jgi:hypothetical protein